MKEFLETYRKDVEGLWDDQTISPKFLPIDDTKPVSAGQCAPTSWVLLQLLRQKYPGKNFTLAIGEVYQDQSVVIEYHVWIVEIAASPRENKIVDVTGDQSGKLPEVIYEEVRALASRGIVYVAYEMSHGARFIHEKAAPRAKLLAERYSSRTI